MNEHSRRVAIVTDDPGWHGRELQNALKDCELESSFVSLTDCVLQISKPSHELILPGFDQLPLGVFVRGVPGGSLEQVVFRLNILHALHDLGITVYNAPRAIERTVDKSLTSFLLGRAGLPTPQTWICESLEHALYILQKESDRENKLLLKPLFGSQGIGIHLVDVDTGLIYDEKFSGVYYLQRFIKRKHKDYADIRVFVIDGLAIAAMTRRSGYWITNCAQGAICEKIEIDECIRTLAEDACSVLNIDYAGVDLIQDDEGNYFIIEVNSIPAWYRLQNVVDFNIALCLIHSFVRRIDKNNKLELYSNVDL